MKKYSCFVNPFIALLLVAASTTMGLSAAHAEQIDVSYLQTCLKTEGSSLDVLVLMDSSASLRNARSDDGYIRANKEGSDPDRKRGKILKSSLKILRSLADESDRNFNISLRNFGNNSDPKEYKNLTQHWIPWTNKTSDSDLNYFVEQALYDDSTMTEWTNGLISAKNQFKERIGQAELHDTKSCPIMFWITDGAPTDPTEPICAADTNASINWFRENNILILGGLLLPKGADRIKAAKFKPMITGENCGENREGWTRGEVIEAKEISDLAWGFVGLIASIKNLVNLNGSNSTFYVDPSTSHIEIFIRGTDQQNWEIKQADGATYCSSSNLGTRCQSSPDPEIGITTISVFPENPVAAAGTWSLFPAMQEGNFQAYGGLSTIDGPQGKQPKLIVTPASKEVEEGKEVSFQAKIVNPDGTDFSINGYKSITICAKIESSKSPFCKSGGAAALLSVSPAVSDKSVGFEAILVSAHDGDREYRIAASAKINVVPSGVFPSLACAKDPCQLENLANKNSHPVNTLKIRAAKTGASDGKVSLIGYTVLSDDVEGRNFTFQVKKENGDVIAWDSQNTSFAPGDKLLLSVSTDLAGKSEIQGVIKYKVAAGGKEIVRQLGFKFHVENASNSWLQLALLLLAYLITLGLPYLFLLWLVRRSAVLHVADGEFSYLVLPFEITKDGKVRGIGEIPAGSTFAPNHRNLVKTSVASNARSISFDQAKVFSVPPKWNPFGTVKTYVSIPGNYVLPTCGNQTLEYESAQFVSTLVDEAIVYFPAQGNISPLNIATEVPAFDNAGFDVFESTYEAKISNSILAPTMPVSGNVIFIVPPYGHKEKSLIKVLNTLNTVTPNINWNDKIMELRENSLKAALEQEEANKAKAEIEQTKKEVKSKKGNGTNEEQKVEDEWSATSSTAKWDDDSSLRSKSQEMPETWKNEDPW